MIVILTVMFVVIIILTFFVNFTYEAQWDTWGINNNLHFLLNKFFWNNKLQQLLIINSSVIQCWWAMFSWVPTCKWSRGFRSLYTWVTGKALIVCSIESWEYNSYDLSIESRNLEVLKANEDSLAWSQIKCCIITRVLYWVLRNFMIQ